MRGLFGSVADAIQRKAAAIEAGPGSPWRALLDYPESKSGVSVTALKALQVMSVKACVNVIANGMSQVPLKVMRALPEDGGSEPAAEHPLYRVLHRRPNRWQTSFEFRRTLMFHVLLTDGFFAYKSRVGGRIVELIPFEPGRVAVGRNRDLSRYYDVTGEDGSAKRLTEDDIWHVTGPSWNTWSGLDGTHLAREAIGLSIATEAAHADLHRNGVQTSGLYSLTGEMDEDQHDQLTRWVLAQIGGSNRYKPFILDRDAKFTPIGMKGVDAQHLETRRHQIEEACRAFNVFPQMIGHAGDMSPTFASAEQFFIAHVVHTLGPWYEHLQQSIDVNLIDEDGVFAKFNPDALLRGDMKSEAEYFSKALGGSGGDGWMTPNQIRRIKDWNPVDGGDELPRRQKTEPGNPATDERGAEDDEQGGGPNAVIPFGVDAEGKAYRASQPCGPDGRWLSIGERLQTIIGLRGAGGRPHVMSLGQVRRTKALREKIGESVRGFRYTLSNQAVAHSMKHADLRPRDFEHLPQIVREATDFRSAHAGPMGQPRVHIVHRHQGQTYGVIAQLERHRRWLSVVTFYRM